MMLGVGPTDLNPDIIFIITALTDCPVRWRSYRPLALIFCGFIGFYVILLKVES